MSHDSDDSVSDASDIELLPSSGSGPAVLSAHGTARRGIAAAVGIFALTCCVGLSAAALSSSQRAAAAPRQLGALTPLQLFESPELVNLVTDQRMEMARRFRRGANFQQWSDAHDGVARSLRAVGEKIRRDSPAFAKVLDANRISEPEKAGVMHLLRHLGDERVQSVGEVYRQAVKDSAGMDRASQRRYIVGKLQPRGADIRQLHAEIFEGLPARLASVGEGHWGKPLLKEPERGEEERRLQMMVGANGGYAPVTQAPQLFAQLSSVLQEGESMLNAFKLMFQDQIKNLNVPVLSDLLAASDDFVDFAECGSAAGQAYEKTQQFPTEKLMQCPLTVGDNGMAAISQFLADLGLDPVMLGLSDGK